MLSEMSYPEGYVLRKVYDKGGILWKSRQIY
jgi:hypothetical protein